MSIDDAVCLNSDDDQLLDADEVIGEIMIDWSVIGDLIHTRLHWIRLDCFVFAADWRLDVEARDKANWGQ